MYKDQHKWIQIALMLFDWLISILAFIAAGMWRFGDFAKFLNTTDSKELIIVTLLASIVAFVFSRMYENFFVRGYLHEILKGFVYTLWISLIVSLYSFGTKNAMALSRLTLLYFVIINLVLIYAVHLLIKKCCALHSGGLRGWKLLIITDLENVAPTCQNIQRSDWKDRVMGIIMIDGKKPDHDLLNGSPLITSTDYVDFITRNTVDEILLSITDDHYKADTIIELLAEIAKTGVIVSVKMRFQDINEFCVAKITKLDTFFVATFASRDYDYLMIIIKRVIDILGGFVGLLLAIVAGLFIAPAILIESPGSLLFKQKRVGRNGRIFTMYKFRSMYADAEARKCELMEKNKMKGLLFKVKNDPRITKVGRFIRKTSLDELPQFYNVLTGDMSLVGTRPPTLDEYRHYANYHKKRLSFRPGLTGIWQVSGRNDITDFDEVMQMDLQYIREWSIYLDIKLILKTLVVVMRRKGAE
jgi:exopolysaccharide biosynthesis polyprenyl glycosylphosphotransferase